MSCQFCAMEGFTNAPVVEATNASADKKTSYSCEQNKGQTCLYTAQGVLTCEKKSVKETFSTTDYMYK